MTDSLKQAAQKALEAMEKRKDDAYEERNKVVAALAKVFPSGVARTAIEGWSEDWHGCVYIDLPTGQVSWHFHDSQAHLFDGLPPYTKQWDGHDTPEKYRRLSALQPANQDAARYRWLRQQHWSESSLCVVVQPRQALKLGHDCPAMDRLDAAIDAAISAPQGGQK